MAAPSAPPARREAVAAVRTLWRWVDCARPRREPAALRSAGFGWVLPRPAPCPAVPPKPRRRAAGAASGFALRADGASVELGAASPCLSGSAPGEDAFWSSALGGGTEQRPFESSFASLLRLPRTAPRGRGVFAEDKAGACGHDAAAWCYRPETEGGRGPETSGLRMPRREGARPGSAAAAGARQPRALLPRSPIVRPGEGCHLLS